MEKYKTPFDLRVDERSFYGGEGGGDKSRAGSGGLARVGRVGVHNGQRLNQFLRDVARAAAAHKSNAAFSKELAKTGDNALKEKIHVCLVYDDGDRGERKRLSVDDGTNFGQVLSRHSPKTAFFSAHRRLSKQERKRERKAGNGAKRASENETQSFGKEQGKKTEGATQESQKVPRPISSAEKSPEKSATSSATYAGKASANLSERTGTGKSSGTSSTGGGGGGGAVESSGRCFRSRSEKNARLIRTPKPLATPKSPHPKSQSSKNSSRAKFATQSCFPRSEDPCTAPSATRSFPRTPARRLERSSSSTSNLASAPPRARDDALRAHRTIPQL